MAVALMGACCPWIWPMPLPAQRPSTSLLDCSSSRRALGLAPTPWRQALRQADPDLVMHLAAESHVDRSIEGPGAYGSTRSPDCVTIASNVNGTFHLLQAVRAHWQQLPAKRQVAFRFHHISTDEVFGSLGATGRFSETTPYDPRSPTSASKAASDHLVNAWHHTYGLPVVLTNCSNNDGPWQFPEKLIPVVILTELGWCQRLREQGRTSGGQLRWTGFSGQGPSLTSEAGHHP